MPTHETIYLSFGTFANHITTSFFNEQAAYLGTQNDELVDSAVALAEGPGFSTGLHSEPQLYPRALLFDVQDQIGSLSQRTGVTDDDELLLSQLNAAQSDENALVNAQNASAATGAELFDTVLDFRTFLPNNEELERRPLHSRQPRRAQDQYDLDLDDARDTGVPKAERRAATPEPRHSRARNLLWSDYQQFYLHPKSIISVKGGPMQGPCAAMAGSTAQQIRRTRRLSALSTSSAESEDEDDDDESNALAMNGFETGYTVAKEMDTDGDAFEDRVRWLAEDSDALQSFNLTATTTDAFSGLAHAYMEHVNDEYGRVPVTAWGATWRLPWRFGMTPQTLFDVEQMSARAVRRGMTRSMNFALSLGLLAGHENGIFTPLLPPNVTEDALASYHSSSMFDTSALLAAHVETATLPTRLFSSVPGAESTGSFVDRVNWRQDTHLANLGGAIPVPVLPIDRQVAALSDPVEAALAEFRARRGLGSSKEDRFDAERLPPRVAAQRAAERAAQALRPHWVDMSNAALQAPNGSKASQLVASTLPFSQSFVVRDARAPERERVLHALRHLASSGEQEILQAPFSSYVGLPANWQVSKGFPALFSGLDASDSPAAVGPSPATPFGVMDVSKDLDLSDPAAVAKFMTPRAGPQEERGQPQSVSVASGLATSPAPTAYMLRCAQSVIQAAINRPEVMLSHYGLGTGADEGIIGGRDGLKEVHEQLERALEGYEAGLPEGYEEAFTAAFSHGDGRDQDENWEEDDEWDI